MLTLPLVLFAYPAFVHRGSVVEIPILSSTVCSVYDFGARGDGRQDDTAALQAALNACGKGTGGTVVFPKNGTFLSFSLSLPSSARGVALEVVGVLRFNNDTRGWGSNPKACLIISGSDIVLTGGGLVDGQGAAWWPCAKAGCLRPNLVYSDASNLLIKDLTFLNSPNHNLELYSSPQEVMNVSIFAPDSSAAFPSHNTDVGIPPALLTPSLRLKATSFSLTHPIPPSPPFLRALMCMAVLPLFITVLYPWVMIMLLCTQTTLLLKTVGLALGTGRQSARLGKRPI